MKTVFAGITLLIFLLPALALGEPPSRPFKSFTTSVKRLARDVIYAGHEITFYCACAYAPNATGSSGVIDPTGCGYKPRKSEAKGKVLEWEHVVPARFFGEHRTCWTDGHDDCKKPNGDRFKGRDCCKKVEPAFKRIEADLHNLTPAVGEINGDRSDHPYGVVEGPATDYGACDFKLGGDPKVAEPRNQVKGDAARIWLYMSDTYAVALTAAQRTMFEQWSAIDPVDEFERLRNDRIEAAHGNRNPFIKRISGAGSDIAKTGLVAGQELLKWAPEIR